MRRIVAAGTSQIACRPLGRVGLHVLDQLRERGRAVEHAVGEHVAVGADLDRVDVVAALRAPASMPACRAAPRAARAVPHQRLAASRGRAGSSRCGPTR